MIKFLLNKISRPVLQRAARLAMPFVRAFYALGRGRTGGVQCPICGGRYRRMMPYGYVSTRANALCPKCLSLERHRLLWLWLGRETDFFASTDNSSAADKKFLHIAPEVCLSKRFEKIFSAENYITADLESPLARVKMDVQAIPFADETFDIVFCNHVLEHVPDDRKAMRELFRVLKRGVWGVVLSPVELSRERTFEDDSITSRDERTRIFGQYDHRRIYGRDYADRLREAGFEVAEVDFFARLSPAERRLYALRSEILYIVSKR